jgi:hypothetical protein
MNDSKQPIKHVEWERRIAAQKKSGLTAAEFCKKEGVSEGRFFYYKKIFKESHDEAMNLFRPVKISELPAAEIRVSLPNGLQCHFSSEIDATALKKLMGALLSC